jgi:hypothetical protein
MRIPNSLEIRMDVKTKTPAAGWRSEAGAILPKKYYMTEGTFCQGKR